MEAVDVRIHRLLSDKFIQIVAKHNNPIWAIEELEWLVFDKHGEELRNAPEDVQREVGLYMRAITKLYK